MSKKEKNGTELIFTIKGMIRERKTRLVASKAALCSHSS